MSYEILRSKGLFIAECGNDYIKAPNNKGWRDDLTESYSGNSGNIVVLTGNVQENNNITIIDVDNKPLYYDEEGYSTTQVTQLKGGSTLNFWDELVQANEPINTFTVSTQSGGLHLYFKYNPKVKSANKVNNVHIDILNDNKWAMAPPSKIKYDNSKYSDWLVYPAPIKINGSLYSEYKILKDCDIAEMPQWLEDWINSNEIVSDNVFDSDSSLGHSTETDTEYLSKLVHLLDKTYYDNYDKWVKVGMIIYNEMGNDGLNLFNDFSIKSDKYTSLDDIINKYNSFNNVDNKIRIGTLVKYVKECNLKEFEKLNKHINNSKKIFKEEEKRLKEEEKRLKDEKKRMKEDEKQILKEEENRLKEEQKRMKEEEKRKKEEEKHMKEEEKRKKEEEKHMKEEEKRMKEEEKRMKEEEKQILKNEQKRQKEELQRMKEEHQQRQKEERQRMKEEELRFKEERQRIKEDLERKQDEYEQECLRRIQEMNKIKPVEKMGQFDDSPYTYIKFVDELNNTIFDDIVELTQFVAININRVAVLIDHKVVLLKTHVSTSVTLKLDLKKDFDKTVKLNYLEPNRNIKTLRDLLFHKANLMHMYQEIYTGFDNDNVDPELFKTTRPYIGRIVPYTTEELSPVLDFIKEIICDSDEEAYNYLIKWLAFTCQHKNRKSGKCPVLYSANEGCGKTFFVEFFTKYVIGDHITALLPSIEAITTEKNLHLMNKKIIYINESSSMKERFLADFDKLKGLLTESKLSIRALYKDAFQSEQYFELIITTNHVNCLSLNKGDRRYFPIRISNKRCQDANYFNSLDKQINNNDFGNKFYSYLMDLPNINYVTVQDVPKTALKLEMLDNLKTSLDSFIDDIINGSYKVQCEIKDGRYKVFCSHLYIEYKNYQNKYFGNEKVKSLIKFNSFFKSDDSPYKQSVTWVRSTNKGGDYFLIEALQTDIVSDDLTDLNDLRE